jgi:uncharacterized membrane protein YcfT
MKKLSEGILITSRFGQIFMLFSLSPLPNLLLLIGKNVVTIYWKYILVLLLFITTGQNHTMNIYNWTKSIGVLEDSQIVAMIKLPMIFPLRRNP